MLEAFYLTSYPIYRIGENPTIGENLILPNIKDAAFCMIGYACVHKINAIPLSRVLIESKKYS